VISTVNAFHGRTLMTVTAGGQPKYSSGFGPNPAGFTHIPYNDVAALEAEFAHGNDICAVMLEPMQGEGGMTPGTPAFLQAARRLTKEHGALFILDEIQSGMGRTGTLFSYMQKGFVPDILTSAKGLGGGFPIGAMLTTTEIAAAFSAGVHGSTFGGNPLACAVAGAVFDIINTTEVLDGVKARHALFMEGLKAINARRPVFSALRGEGVWLGCELAEEWRGKAGAVMQAAGDAGLLVLMAGPDVIRLAPPLTISLDEILEGLARLETALNTALVAR
jgi:acetylornithine/N-succinyldiaminopimelate aminotransferase